MLTSIPTVGETASINSDYSNYKDYTGITKVTTTNSQVSTNLCSTGMIITGNGTSAVSQYTFSAASPPSIGIVAQPISAIFPNTVMQSQNISSYAINNVQSSSTISITNSNNKEIVRLNKDGSVTWANGINVDEAATAFSKSLQLGAERSAGVTAGVKQRMRDTIFEEMIEMAKIKGTLDANELTYMLSAAKIMDKLKGGYE